MNERTRDRVKKEFPAFHQLLVEVLAGQYDADPVASAIREYAASTTATDCAAAIRELDAAAPLVVADYADMSRFLNYHLESPEDARILLGSLRQGLLTALAPRGT